MLASRSEDRRPGVVSRHSHTMSAFDSNPRCGNRLRRTRSIPATGGPISFDAGAIEPGVVARELADYAARRSVHYGWVVAALTFFYIVFSSSAVSIPRVLIRPRRMSLA